MNSSIEKIIEQKDTKHLLQTVRDYCTFIELTDKTYKEFLRLAQKVLLTLYQQAITLPWITKEHNEDVKVESSEETYENVFKNIADKIGDDRFYWTVFDPTDDKDTEAVCGDLADGTGFVNLLN